MKLATKTIDEMTPDEIAHALGERFGIVPELLDDETLSDLLAAEAYIRAYNKDTIDKDLGTCAGWSLYTNQIEIKTLEGRLIRSYKVLSNPDQDPWASRILLLDQMKFPEVTQYDDTLVLAVPEGMDISAAEVTKHYRKMPTILVVPWDSAYGKQALVYFDNEEDACRLSRKFWVEVHPGQIMFGRKPTLLDWGRELTYGDRTIVNQTYDEDEKKAWKTLFLGNGCPLSEKAWAWLNALGGR